MLLGVSHDLRSPLARIRVAADLLEGEGARLRELIVKNVIEAVSIIESFLTYTRADGEVRREPIDLGSGGTDRRRAGATAAGANGGARAGRGARATRRSSSGSSPT